MKKTIDIMVQLLDKNNIPVQEGARKKDGSSRHVNKERCHALVSGSSYSSSLIIDLGESSHMDSVKYFFTTMYSESGPNARMGDYLDIQMKGIGRIDLEDGFFNNVLFVPELEVNLISMYQMTHTSESKRVKFTPDPVEID